MNATVATVDLVFKAAGPMRLDRILRAYLAAATLRVPADAARAGVHVSVPRAACGDLPPVRRGDRAVIARGRAANPEHRELPVLGLLRVRGDGPGDLRRRRAVSRSSATGLLKLKRALPARRGAYLIAKMAMAMAFAALAVGTVTIAALAAGRYQLRPAQLAIMLS